MKRIHSLDLARGFTVLMIAPIHTVLIYSSPEVYKTWMVWLLRCIAEGPGAQLFMLLMGIYTTLQLRKSFSVILQRAAILLFTGYTLNLLKFVLPFKFGLLSNEMLEDIQADKPIQLFMIGDILQFAGIALPIIHILRTRKYYPYWAALIAVAVCLLAPVFWDMGNCYASQLIGGHPPQVFFPLFPWLVYPMVGLCIGRFLNSDTPTPFARLFFLGIALLQLGLFLNYTVYKEPSPSLYRTLPGDTIIHLSIVLIWLWLWEFLYQRANDNAFFTLLRYCSKNITVIYLIQWPVIIWLIPLFGYRQLDTSQTILAIFITSSSTFLICKHTKHLISSVSA